MTTLFYVDRYIGVSLWDNLLTRVELNAEEGKRRHRFKYRFRCKRLLRILI